MNATQFACETLERIQDAAERAQLALEKLEDALNEGNQKAIGAAMHELDRALKEIKQISEQE